MIVLFLVVSACSLISCKAATLDDKNDNQITGFAYKKNIDDIVDKGPVKVGTLKLFSTNPDTLNPILTENTFVQDFSGLIFESLVKIDKSQKPVPLLADSWGVSNGGMVWIFHIRENVFWHDKIPLTSEDVDFTFETILNDKIKSVYKKNLKNIAAFSSIDRNIFRIVLKKPYSFTAELMTFPILPKHYFQGEDMTNLNSLKNLSPIGTGPYKFQSYNKKSNILLKACDDWWGSKSDNNEQNGMPYVPEIEIKIYDNAEYAISAFQTRDIDVTPIDTHMFSKYSGRSDLIIKKYTGKNYEFIAFNLSNPVLSDIDVRKALAYTIDKEKIIEKFLPSEAIASDIPVIPDTWLYDTNIISYATNIKKAKDILVQSGWKDKDGVLSKNVNGIITKLTLEILVNDDNDLRLKVAEEISRQLGEIGIKLKIRKISWEEEKQLIDSGKFDMVLTGCRTTAVPDISFLYSSLEIARGFNIAGYKNSTVDSYLDNILSENDSSRKKALFINMKNIIDDEAPYIGLYFFNNTIIYNKKIRGDLNPFIWDKYNGITKCYIPVG